MTDRDMWRDDPSFLSMQAAIGLRVTIPPHLAKNHEVAMLRAQEPFPTPANGEYYFGMDEDGQPINSKVDGELVESMNGKKFMQEMGPFATSLVFRAAGYRIIVSEDRWEHEMALDPNWVVPLHRVAPAE